MNWPVYLLMGIVSIGAFVTGEGFLGAALLVWILVNVWGDWTTIQKTEVETPQPHEGEQGGSQS